MGPGGSKRPTSLYRVSPEIKRVLLENPGLARSAAGLVFRLLPSLEAAAASGAAPRLRPEELADVMELAKECEARGGKRLEGALEQVRAYIIRIQD